MIRSTPILAAVALLASAIVAAPAGAATGISPAHGFVPGRWCSSCGEQRSGRTVDLPAGVGVRQAARALRRSPRVAYAAPNYIATASGASGPAARLRDRQRPGASLHAPRARRAAGSRCSGTSCPGRGSATAPLPVSPGGIDAVGAWQNLIAAERRGARGITVAVLDTGIAYRDDGSRFRRSPDFAAGQFVKGYDFVDHDRVPLDENGHGTHVAGTIAEKTNNGIGLVGLAYRAKLMPVRVLDRNGSGQADDIARGIHFAVAHGADVINMSFNFGCGKSVPGIDEELRDAYRTGVVDGGLDRQPRLGGLRLAAGHRSRTSRRRRHHRGRLPRRLLAAARQGGRPARARRRRPGPRLPLGVEPLDLPGDAERRQPAPLRRAG